jgi:replicative DNA helicase
MVTATKRPTGVYRSAKAVDMMLAQIDERRIALLEKRAVYGFFGIPEIDEYMVPLWPGDLMYVTALPSNAKSFTCRMFEQRVVDLLLNNDDGSRVVVWVTTEESVEKIAAHWLAGMSGVSSTAMLSGKLTEEHQVTLNASVAEVGSWPLYVVGHSSSSRGDDGVKHKSARLSMSEIDACVDFIMNKRGKDIVLLTIDYIHRIRNDSRRDREEHIRTAVDWTRDLAIWLSAPVVVAAQAKSKVGDRKYAMPTIPDVEWSMNAGQSADALLGLWMPKTTLGVGAIIEQFGEYQNIVVTESMLFVAVAKQKDGPGGRIFLLDAQPHMMKWRLMEMKEINLNPHKDVDDGKEITPMGVRWPSAEQGEITF